jgi:hypothetical protein
VTCPVFVGHDELNPARVTVWRGGGVLGRSRMETHRRAGLDGHPLNGKPAFAFSASNRIFEGDLSYVAFSVSCISVAQR